MCGICGFSKPDAPVNRELFENMIDLIAYRGPDGRGSYYQDYLALGHRRLAILDLSDMGGQPLAYLHYRIVYNGEVYNYLQIKEDLQQQGYTFTTATDTEVLVAAYDCYGPDCVQHFNGMWAFCIFDTQKNTLFCSRDRYGVKPFYYILQQGQLAFASEIKQLLLLDLAPPRVNQEALARFLVLGELDNSEDTLFTGIQQLLPGHSMTFDIASRALSFHHWFLPVNQPSYSDSPAGYAQACHDYQNLFVEAVRLRLQAEVKVGSCLSGGLDSSAIVGAVHDILDQNGQTHLQHTVSSCYEQAEFNEQKYIDLVLEKTGAVSHKIFPQLQSDTAWLDQIVWHMDEPIPSSSAFSQWCVFEEARKQGLEVLLDGQGADEQLAGYAQYYSIYFTHLLRQGKWRDFRRELRAYKELRSQYQPVSTLAVSLYCMASAFLPKFLLQKINRSVIKKRRPALFLHPVWQQLELQSPQFTMPSPREYIQHNMKGPLRLLLHLEDRNSMAHSVESRVPYMDPDLVACADSMPFSFKIREGMSKAILRDSLSPFLPEEIRLRQNKMGFPAPENEWILKNQTWFEGQLKEACRRFPALLSEETVLEGFHAFLQQPKTGEFVWWRIMCANRWAEIFKVQTLDT